MQKNVPKNLVYKDVQFQVMKLPKNLVYKDVQFQVMELPLLLMGGMGFDFVHHIPAGARQYSTLGGTQIIMGMS